VSVLRGLRSLLLGETWSLPLGLAAVVLGTALVVRPLLGHTWRHGGGFVLLGGVLIVVVASVLRSAGRRPRG
jgi:hypothetical protein